MTFAPPASNISNITNADPGVVTTQTAHSLVTGMMVRLNIPYAYGMQELNKTTPVVTVLSPTTFSIQYTLQPTPQNINTKNFSAFTTPSLTKTPPQVVPMGSSSRLDATGRYFEDGLGDATTNYSTTPIPF